MSAVGLEMTGDKSAAGENYQRQTGGKTCQTEIARSAFFDRGGGIDFMHYSFSEALRYIFQFLKGNGDGVERLEYSHTFGAIGQMFGYNGAVFCTQLVVQH